MAWLSCKPVENSQGRVYEAGRECQTSQFWDVWVVLSERYDLDEERRAARFSAQAPGTGPRSKDVYVHPLQLLGLDRADCEQRIAAAGLPSPGLSSCVFCASMRPEEVDELNPNELWLIVILEAHAQVNLHTIRGLWGHGERMTEYIIRRGLLPKQLVDDVWQKWLASSRPAELVEGASADAVLFAEVRRLVCLSEQWYRPHTGEPAAAIYEPPMSYCLKPRPNRTDVLNWCDFTPIKELVVWPN